MLSRRPTSPVPWMLATSVLTFGMLFATPGATQPGPDHPPAESDEKKPEKKPTLLGAEPEHSDEIGRSPELRDPFAEVDEAPRADRRPPVQVAVDPTPTKAPIRTPKAAPERSSMKAHSFQLFGQTVMASLDEFGLHSAIGVDDPDPLVDKDLRLDGDGSLLGAGFRGTIQVRDGWRIGLGGSFAALDGVQLLHEPLQDGVRVALGNALAVGIETSLGKAFDLAPVYPYLDLRTVVHVVSAQIGLGTDEYGFVGATPYNVVSFTLAPRLGLFVPIDDMLFLDVSGQYGMFGIERAGLFAGFGVWTGDAEH